MHFRRLSCFLLGAWFAGSLLAVWLIHAIPGSPDSILRNPTPAAAAQLKDARPAALRAAAQFVAAEQTRSYQAIWDTVQLALATVLVIYMLFGSSESKVALAMAGAMLFLTLLQRAFLTPEIADLGRITDFAPPGVLDAERAKMGVLQSGYLVLEGVKWVAGLIVTGNFVFGSSRRLGLVRQNLDVVNKPDHRHIQR
jgi:hypothetical protein